MLIADFFNSFTASLATSFAAGLAIGGSLLYVFLQRTVQGAVERALRQQTLELEWQQKVREQAAKVAEYLSYSSFLQETDSSETFRKANQLGWELAVYLPDELYLHVRDAVVSPAVGRNQLTALVATRKHLLRSKAGSLLADDVAFHAPGVGRKSAAS